MPAEKIDTLVIGGGQAGRCGCRIFRFGTRYRHRRARLIRQRHANGTGVAPKNPQM
jgi:hypothetical protein